MSGLTEWMSERPVSAGPAWLAGELETRVRDGGLAAGDRLPSSRELCQMFSLGRPAVREALRSLAERQLIEIVPGRGAFVRAPRPTDASGPVELLLRRQSSTPRHLVEARKMLEAEAATLAVERATAEDLARLARTLDGFDAAGSLAQRAEMDIEFHFGIARAAHNPVLETMFGAISGLTRELVLRSLGDARVSREGLPFHAEILNALVRRDTDRARRAVLGHLEVGERCYGLDFDRPLNDLAARPRGPETSPSGNAGREGL